MDREEIQQQVKESIRRGTPSSWFEILYAKSNRDPVQVPWADLKPNSHLLSWLTHHKGEMKKALVVGCGLGDDAEELARSGFETTAFDISPSAIQWCQERFPTTAVRYHVADIFDPPPNWIHAYHFVFESYTIQALPIESRQKIKKAIAQFVAPEGTLLVVGSAQRKDQITEGPPWPLRHSDVESFSAFGLKKTSFEKKADETDPYSAVFIGTYVRPSI